MITNLLHRNHVLWKQNMNDFMKNRKVRIPLRSGTIPCKMGDSLVLHLIEPTTITGTNDQVIIPSADYLVKNYYRNGLGVFFTIEYNDKCYVIESTNFEQVPHE